jgi:hypothetical protein
VARLAQIQADALAESDEWGRAPFRPPALGLAGWLIAAYVALLPAQISLGASARLAISDLFMMGYAILRSTDLRVLRAAWTGWLGAILACVTVGAFVAALSHGISYGTCVQKAIGLLFLFLTLVCLHDFMRTWNHVRWVFRIFVRAVTAHTTFFLMIMLAQNVGLLAWPSMNLGGARLAGLLIDPNAFGGLILVALVINATTRANGQALLRGRGAMLANAALAGGLLFTYSRSAWVGAFLALAGFAMLYPKKALTGFIRALPGMALAAAVVALTILPTVMHLAQRPDQVQDRVSILSLAFNDFFTHPILGIGLGTSDVLHGQIVHNTTVWFLTEFGPFGLISILGFVGSHAVMAFTAHRRLSRTQRVLPAALLLAHVGVYGLSLGIESLYQRHWWLILAGIGVTFAAATDGLSLESPEGAPAATSPLATRAKGQALVHARSPRLGLAGISPIGDEDGGHDPTR